MHRSKIYALIIFLIFPSTGFSDDPEEQKFTPRSEDECNVSCNFSDQEFDPCFKDPAVNEYTLNDLLMPKLDKISHVVANLSIQTCFCGYGTLDENGKFLSVEVKTTSSDRLAEHIVRELLEGEAVPIPEAAICIVDKTIPISINTWRR